MKAALTGCSFRVRCHGTEKGSQTGSSHERVQVSGPSRCVPEHVLVHPRRESGAVAADGIPPTVELVVALRDAQAVAGRRPAGRVSYCIDEPVRYDHASRTM